MVLINSISVNSAHPCSLNIFVVCPWWWWLRNESIKRHTLFNHWLLDITTTAGGMMVMWCHTRHHIFRVPIVDDCTISIP